MDGKPWLLDQLRDQIRLKHYSIRVKHRRYIYRVWPAITGLKSVKKPQEYAFYCVFFALKAWLVCIPLS